MTDMGSGAGRPPLSALLSQVLVAFIIEFDNEFERQMPHRTSGHGRTQGRGAVPWLVSMAMWSTCLRFVGDGGITVRELAKRVRTGTNLAGMQRWGYITVAPDPAGTRAKPPRSDWVVRATTSGCRAQHVWQPLTGVIEERWAARFGTNTMAALKEPLQVVSEQLDPALPDCLPILGHGLWSTPDRGRPADHKRPGPGHRRPAPEPEQHKDPPQPRADLPVLLSRVLLAFAVEFEHESPVSLAISANVLRVLDEHGVRVRDLPGLSGVSKEGISMAMGILATRGLAVCGPAPDGGRWQVAALTPRGRSVQNKCRERLTETERRWQARFGGEAVTALREALERLVGDPGARLAAGLEPPPGGWRASVRRPGTLPQYPMVLHRGGFPDGS
ncbi:MAG TPA: MarR family winged helix-turn-helix transcriptional regulator [Streptosporangiaceae bacterium]